ncbi:MAG: STAS domain-containing protein [Candidatus Dormiibacterota bacterium]
MGRQIVDGLAGTGVLTAERGGPGWLTLAGTLGQFNAESLPALVNQELRAARVSANGWPAVGADDRKLHLDLTRVEFLDTTGIQALSRLAAEVERGTVLVFHGLPASIRRVMSMVGWGALPNLVIDGDASESP